MIRIRKWTSKNTWIWSFVGSLVIFIAISLLGSTGFTLKTLLMNVTLATFVFLLGISEMLVISSGDGAIDLSIPYTVTLCAYVSATCLRGDGAFLGVLIILGICILVGFINGVINVYLHIHSMIGTLAIGYILFTVVLVYSTNATVKPSENLSQFTQSQFGGFSVLTVLCIIFAVVMFIIMYKTGFGKKIHAIGQGKHIAELAGIKASKTIILVFIISSVIAGATGVLLGGYTNGSFQSMGDAYLMPAIAAALVGGTLVSGGKSSVLGTFGGAIMLTLLGTLINITNLSAGWQDLIEGAVIILVLAAA